MKRGSVHHTRMTMYATTPTFDMTIDVFDAAHAGALHIQERYETSVLAAIAHLAAATWPNVHELVLRVDDETGRVNAAGATLNDETFATADILSHVGTLSDNPQLWGINSTYRRNGADITIPMTAICTDAMVDLEQRSDDHRNAQHRLATTGAAAIAAWARCVNSRARFVLAIVNDERTGLSVVSMDDDGGEAIHVDDQDLWWIENVAARTPPITHNAMWRASTNIDDLTIDVDRAIAARQNNPRE